MKRNLLIRSAGLVALSTDGAGAIHSTPCLSLEHGPIAVHGAQPDDAQVIPCRDLFSRASDTVQVTGPLLVEEALDVHNGFWSPPAA
jgi:hypothetical protein